MSTCARIVVLSSIGALWSCAGEGTPDNKDHHRTSDTADEADTGGDEDPRPEASLLDVQSPAELACAITFSVNHEAWSLPSHAEIIDAAGDAIQAPIHWTGTSGRVIGLRANSEYTLRLTLVASADEPEPPVLEAQAVTGALPEDLPPIVVSVGAERESAELTVFPVARWNPVADVTWGYLVAVDPQGEVVWYWSAGELLVGFHVEHDADGVPWVFTAGFLDSAIAVNPFTGEERTLEASDTALDSIHHEVRPAESGALVVLSTEVREISGWGGETYNIVGDVLAEVDWSGEVVWETSVLDHIDPTEIWTVDMHAAFWSVGPYEDVDTPKDWSHGNAIALDEASERWIGSFRNIDQVIAFDRMTGGVAWAFGPDGDFALAEGSRWSSRQHSPSVTDAGTLLIYDNGNARADAGSDELPWSRVVEYRLDEETMVAEEVWSWAGESPYFSPIVGDVDRLDPARHLITDGAVVNGVVDLGDGNTINHLSARIRELDGLAEPEVVWELVVGSPGQTDQNGATVYRSERIESLWPTP